MANWSRGSSRRSFVLAGGASIASLTLLACGGSEATPAQSGQPAKIGSRQADLRMHVRAGTEADTLDKRLPELTQKFPTIKTTIEPFPTADYLTKITALMAAGSLGDVIWGGNAQSQSSKWAHLGGLRQMDDLVRTEKFDLSQYYKGSVDGGKLDGKMFGLPFKLHPSHSVIYTNMNALSEEGQKHPDANTTWDQLIDQSRRLKKGDRWGIIIPATGQAGQYWFTWGRSWGAELLSADGKKAQLDDSKFIAAVQFAYDLTFKHQVAPGFQQLSAIRGAGTGFENGLGGMLQGSSSQKSMPTRIQSKFQVGNFLWPKGPSGQRGSIAISDYIHMAKQSQFPQEAWELAKHLCDKETGIRLGEGTGGASGTCGARPDVYKHERIMANPLHKVWLEAVEQVMPFREPFNFRMQDIEDQALKPAFDKLWKGEETPSGPYMKQLNDQVQRILDQPRGA